MIAELGLHDGAVADLLCEDSLVKLGNHAATRRSTEFAAGVLAARVVGVLLGQIGKVGAALDLLQQALSLGLSRRI